MYHLTGDFFGSEEYGFYLYPVFADGEGEPIYTIGETNIHMFFCSITFIPFSTFNLSSPPVPATRGDPAAYMMLMIISFLSIVLFVTLILSQNQ